MTISRPPGVAGIVLAAGAGTRFGGSVKQLHLLDGRPMLEHVLATMAGAELDEVIVVLGANAERRAGSSRPAWRAGRWSAGAGRTARPRRCRTRSPRPSADAALIVLGDGPRLSADAVRRVAAVGEPAAADYGSGRSHPVLLPRAVWGSLPSTGETPGREVPVRLVDCGDLPPPGDVDYPD